MLFNKNSSTTTKDSQNKPTTLAGYEGMDTKDLKSLPNSSLISIIYKFDNDVISLNQEILLYKDMIKDLQLKVDQAEENANSYRILFFAKREELESQSQKYAECLEELENTLSELTQCRKNVYKQNPSSSSKELFEKLTSQKKLIKDLQTSMTVIEEEKTTLKEIIEKGKEEKQTLLIEISSLNELVSEYKQPKANEETEVSLHSSNCNCLSTKQKAVHENANGNINRNRSKVKRKKHRHTENGSEKNQNKTIKEVCIDKQMIAKEIHTENRRKSRDFKETIQKLQEELKESKETILQLSKSKEDLRLQLKTFRLSNNGDWTSPETLFSLKLALERIYKELLIEINRSVENDHSIYSLQSTHFTNIEKELNDIIVDIQEKIEKPNTRKVMKGRSSVADIQNFFSRMDPRQLKRRNSEFKRVFSALDS